MAGPAGMYGGLRPDGNGGVKKASDAKDKNMKASSGTPMPAKVKQAKGPGSRKK